MKKSDKEQLKHHVALTKDANDETDTRRQSAIDQFNHTISQLVALNKKKSWKLEPGSPFMLKWDLNILVLLGFTAMVTPFEVAFLESGSYDTLFFINLVVTLGFVQDMCMQFFLCYENEHTKEIVTSRRLIARKYLRGWFVLDFISIFPFDFVGQSSGGSASSGDSLRILRFVRLLRLLKLLRIVRASRIIGRWESKIRLSFATISLIKFSLCLMLLLHWLACGWKMGANFSLDYYTTGEFKNWVEQMKMTNNIGSQYWQCIYTAQMLLMSGFLSPITNTERVTAVILMPIAGTVYIYVVASMCMIIESMDRPTKLFRNNVDSLNSFANENMLEKGLACQIRAFLMRAKAIHRQHFYSKTLALVSPKLQGRVNAQVHGNLLECLITAWNIKGIAPEEMDAWMLVLVTKLECGIYIPQEHLIVPRERADKMFIIRAGLVGQLGRVCGKKQVLGLDCLLEEFSMKRHYTAIALTYVNAYTLTNSAIREACSIDTPNIEKQMRKYTIRLYIFRMLAEIVRDPESMPPALKALAADKQAGKQFSEHIKEANKQHKNVKEQSALVPEVTFAKINAGDWKTLSGSLDSMQQQKRKTLAAITEQAADVQAIVNLLQDMKDKPLKQRPRAVDDVISMI